ncbi:enoyl-CoA hydratase [soil metagenome]
MQFGDIDSTATAHVGEQVSAVTVTVEANIALVVLKAPERANALTLADAEGLLDEFRRLGEDPAVSCIVLAAEGPVFCAGAHRSVLASLSGEDGPRIMSEFYSVFQAIVECPIPTIAAVEGAAVGAGLNLALCCDMMVATHSTRLDARFLTLGMHPGGGHSWLLRRVLGRSQALAVGLSVEVLDGARAHQLGVATRLVADGEARSEALAMASGIGRTRRELVVRAKQTISTVPEDYAESRAIELGAQLWSLQKTTAPERSVQ